MVWEEREGLREMVNDGGEQKFALREINGIEI